MTRSTWLRSRKRHRCSIKQPTNFPRSATTSRAFNTNLTPSQVSNAVETLQTQLTSVLSTTQSAARGAELLFPMLGGDGPRHYLLAFQSNSEARGTGGLLGSYGIVSADNGHVHIDKLASREELDSQTYQPCAGQFR